MHKKNDPLDAILLVLFLAGINLCFYIADTAYHRTVFTKPDKSTAIENNTAGLQNGTVELCKQYRRWQALPEIKGVTTSMDTLCEKLGY